MSQISCPCTETAYTTIDVHFKFILYWLWVPCATWLIRGAISRHTNDQNMVSLHRGCITLRLHHTWDMSHIQLRVKCKTWSCITLSHVSFIRLFHRSLLYVSFIGFFYRSLIYVYLYWFLLHTTPSLPLYEWIRYRVFAPQSLALHERTQHPLLIFIYGEASTNTT